MKRNVGGIIVILVIVGIVGYIIVSTIIEDNKTVPPVDDDHVYRDDAATEEETGWPPNVGGVELEENKLKKNYYLVLDGSGSMSGDKMKTAKEALTRFINLVPADANLGLVVFDSRGISERAALGSSRQELLDQIKKVNASGYTPLRTSLNIAYEKINQQAARQLGYGEYNIVVVTDGEASDGEEPNYIVDTILRESPVIIHTIGFQIGEYHSLNQPGRVLYKPANNFEELSEGLEDVLAELEDFAVTDFNKE
ncbi:MAG: VWA domain-containing protein [Spirochaetales bacterium]|nr:VWA domain-containing protein [Spirochaetales bacterium]